MQEKKTLLFIDSDVNFCEDMQRRFMLEPEFEVTGLSTTAMDGFSKTQMLQPRYAIIASSLPDADASQLVSNMRMVSPKTSVIVALEVDNPMAIAQYMQLGASYTLVKPFSADKLIDVIRTLDRNIGGGFGQQPQTMPGFGQQQPQQQPFGQQQAPVFNQFQQNPGFGQQQQTGNSMDALRGAMNQMAQNADAKSQTPVNPFGQPQTFQQPNMFPQQPQPVMFQNQGGAPAGFGMGGFPSPQMAPPAAVMQDALGMNSGGARGGFRTIKRTVIAVTCPKGGVGKSTISKEMALAFATVRVGGQPLRVLLMDCNLDFGDVASMLSVNPHPNITHWTADIAQRLRDTAPENIRYSSPQIDKYLITHESGLKILAAPSNHSDAVNITESQTKVVFNNIENSDFDVIILDTGNNTKDFTLQALDIANVVLMVTTLDVTTINDTQMLLNTLRSFDFATSKIQLIVNKLPKSDRDLDVGEISTVLRSPIIGTIPDFPRIRQLNNAGTPAVLGKENEFTAAIRKIANTIIPVFNRAVPQQGGPAPQRQAKEPGGGLFGKLFGKK